MIIGQMQRFLMDSLSADINVYMGRHKNALLHAMTLSVNNRLFAHSDVSLRINNGENDHVM